MGQNNEKDFLQLVKTYHQIPVQEEDVPTAVTATPFGLFDFPYMPFELSNAAATFWKFIDHFLRGVDFCVPYFADVLVTSESDRHNSQHFKQVFRSFEEYGVRQNASKCVLGKSAVQFLVHIVTPEGISTRSEKKATVLYHPSANAIFATVVDGSDCAISITLQQQVATGWQPLAFYCLIYKSLPPAQRRYSPYVRELLAAYMAIKNFRHMVEDRSFIVFTDHKLYTYAFRQKEDRRSPRQLRQPDIIFQFTTDVRHLIGTDKVIAEPSRMHIPPNETQFAIDFKNIAEEQQADPNCKIFSPHQLLD
ncbi:hypothetical protein AVEN_154292-1 [Araneus ventricosus]|uniref:Uncharacterized protein n=1 Tax=Araneus ventricosus TaxID=182803 RepID=A0A4Y2UVP5_ARAVE|nr:hypothetical protein AVEN_154292-1 [Araneus ventricosus]